MNTFYEGVIKNTNYFKAYFRMFYNLKIKKVMYIVFMAIFLFFLSRFILFTFVYFQIILKLNPHNYFINTLLKSTFF